MRIVDRGARDVTDGAAGGGADGAAGHGAARDRAAGEGANGEPTANGPRHGSTRRHGATRLAALGGWAIVLTLVGAGVLAVVLTLAGSARAASPSAPGSGGAQTTGTDVAAGAQLFQQSCASCHGVQGQGISGRGPNIQNAGAAAADFVLRTGRMPLANPNQPMSRAQPAFDADKIRQLVAFVASLGKGPAIPQVTTNGADLSHGRALFTANCAACHAPTGAGDAVGGGFNAPGLGNADPTTVAEAMRIGPPPMPVFDPNSFSQKDVNDIAAYVQYLQSAPSPGGLGIGEIGPVPEGFVAFVFGLTVFMLVVRFVGRRGRLTSVEADPEDAGGGRR